MFPKIQGITRYDKVEVIIPNSFQKNFIKFGDQPQLRSDDQYDIAIQAIETFTQFDQSVSQSGNTMPTVAQLIESALTLYIDGEQQGFLIPLVQLHRAVAVDGSGDQVPYVRDLQLFNNVEVSWEKCNLNCFAANGWNTGASGTFSFEFGIHYVRLPAGTLAKVRQQQNDWIASLPPLRY